MFTYVLKSLAKRYIKVFTPDNKTASFPLYAVKKNVMNIFYFHNKKNQLGQFDFEKNK